MDILRHDQDGVYRCINNPNNKQRYVLAEPVDCIPMLIPLRCTMEYEETDAQQDGEFIPLVVKYNA